MGLFDGTPLERPVTDAHSGEAVTDDTPRDRFGNLCPPAAQLARVRREKRRGKWTTVVYQLDPHASDLRALLKKFKAMCAAGGTTTDDGFELQGDHRDRLVDELKKLGYPAKPAGG